MTRDPAERPAGRSRRRFRRGPPRAILFLVLLALAIAARYWSDQPPPRPRTERADTGSSAAVDVVRVVDGDTIIFVPHRVVRLIGVNTPETVRPEHPVEPFGPEASAFTRKFLAGGTARLSFDRDRIDQYGRQLAYVWVDGRMLNEELLRAGLARWEPNYNYASEVKRRFRAAQEEARDAGRGIWSDGGGDRQSR